MLAVMARVLLYFIAFVGISAAVLVYAVPVARRIWNDYAHGFDALDRRLNPVPKRQKKKET